MVEQGLRFLDKSFQDSIILVECIFDVVTECIHYPIRSVPNDSHTTMERAVNFFCYLKFVFVLQNG